MFRIFSFVTCKKFQSFPWAEHPFLTKFKIAAKRYCEVVIPELFDMYFNVIPHFYTILLAEFISKAICNFWGFVNE